MHPFKWMFLFPLDKYPNIESQDLMVVLFLIFQGTSTLFSIVAAPTYILTKSAWGLPFLHILTNTCYFFFFWMIAVLTVWSSISLWFWLTFPSLFWTFFHQGLRKQHLNQKNEGKFSSLVDLWEISGSMQYQVKWNF